MAAEKEMHWLELSEKNELSSSSFQ